MSELDCAEKIEGYRTDKTIRMISLIDHDKQFETCRDKFNINPAILNAYDLTVPGFIETITALISTDGAGTDFIARCGCGDLEGEQRIGMRCDTCGQKVARESITEEDNLACRTWLKCPDELPHGWLTPNIYMCLASWLGYDRKKKKGARNYLDDILNVDGVVPVDISHVVTGKGFQYLYDNFDRIMKFFIYDHPVTSKKADTPAIEFMLDLYRDRIWCHYIPILPAALNPITRPDSESTARKRQADPISNLVLSAAIILSRIDFGPKRKRERDIIVERGVYEAYKNLIEYNDEATNKFISTKKAIPRTQMFGARQHMSFRGVIVPIVGDHNYDEIHLPWKMSVNLLRVHILAKLCNVYGYGLDTASLKIRKAINIYDPLIDEIMMGLIADSPYPGLPCLWQRPPSIRDGSVKLVFITKVKKDPKESAIGMTPIDVAWQNADFDGDNLAGVLIVETEMVDAFRRMSPSELVFDRNTGAVSSEVGISPSCALTWNRYLGMV